MLHRHLGSFYMDVLYKWFHMFYCVVFTNTYCCFLCGQFEIRTHKSSGQDNAEKKIVQTAVCDKSEEKPCCLETKTYCHFCQISTEPFFTANGHISTDSTFVDLSLRFLFFSKAKLFLFSCLQKLSFFSKLAKGAYYTIYIHSTHQHSLLLSSNALFFTVIFLCTFPAVTWLSYPVVNSRTPGCHFKNYF